MTAWRNLILLAALPAVAAAAAADPDMMNLVMPDARTLVEINLVKIMASPVGAALRDAVHQGVATQLQGELAKSKPQFQEQIAALANIDWSQQVREVLVARGSGPEPATVIIVRTSLDPAHIQALKGFNAAASEYEGVTILASDKPETGAIAFLEGSMVVLGQMADVKAAIHRRGQHTVLPAALAAQVAKYKQDDIWLASTEIITVPALPPAAVKSPAAAEITQFIRKVAGLNAGLRFSPDFDLSADLEARTDKNAAEFSQGLHFFTGQAGQGLQGLKFRMNGRHLLISLHVPEEQMRAGLAQMRAAQAARPATAAARPQQPTVAPPSSGVPPPPAGTIRVQSSEMGTVLLPVDKQP